MSPSLPQVGTTGTADADADAPDIHLASVPPGTLAA